MPHFDWPFPPSFAAEGLSGCKDRLRPRDERLSILKVIFIRRCPFLPTETKRMRRFDGPLPPSVPDQRLSGCKSRVRPHGERSSIPKHSSLELGVDISSTKGRCISIVGVPDTHR
ncbi:hypothetical protein PLEOSDRAFT_1090081 [Pleurotus ostreatus PC15]|uniref:Uncharacterized protein n=1 Tax=Pleurotus ostreatus (strain PC15) TaxID=1137138 RepID=A0A067NN41_PLEO1|nr:hypothetical protein PLEOSDRAFT_1090081 [Pleurotus ostreatus PC15]